MKTGTKAGRASSLVLELGTGTAIVDGKRVELPPKEFSLLAELAAHPGEAMSAEILIERVWPETPGMTPQDLYWHVWQARKLIGDDKRERKVLGNRRRFGYLVDVAPEAVRLLNEPAGEELVDHEVIEVPVAPIILDEGPLDDDELERPVSLIDLEPLPVTETPPRPRARPKAMLVGTLVAALILVASWAAGFTLSKLRSDPGPAPVTESAPGQPDVQRPDGHEGRGKEPRPHDQRQSKGKDRPHRGGAGFADQPTSSTQVAGGAPESSSSRTDSKTPSGDSKTKPVPDYPPAPSRYLYHLFDSDSGDHFVTTDGGIASEYQGKGYSGGAIARIYTYAEKDTKAISTNFGTAYIFEGSSPKTDPASRILALWYATDNNGDFFYTTSKAEATQEGWQATLIGYVRAPR